MFLGNTSLVWKREVKLILIKFQCSKEHRRQRARPYTTHQARLLAPGPKHLFCAPKPNVFGRTQKTESAPWSLRLCYSMAVHCSLGCKVLLKILPLCQWAWQEHFSLKSPERRLNKGARHPVSVSVILCWLKELTLLLTMKASITGEEIVH